MMESDNNRRWQVVVFSFDNENNNLAFPKLIRR